MAKKNKQGVGARKPNLSKAEPMPEVQQQPILAFGERSLLVDEIRAAVRLEIDACPVVAVQLKDGVLHALALVDVSENEHFYRIDSDLEQYARTGAYPYHDLNDMDEGERAEALLDGQQALLCAAIQIARGRACKIYGSNAILVIDRDDSTGMLLYAHGETFLCPCDQSESPCLHILGAQLYKVKQGILNYRTAAIAKAFAKPDGKPAEEAPAEEPAPSEAISEIAEGMETPASSEVTEAELEGAANLDKMSELSYEPAEDIA